MGLLFSALFTYKYALMRYLKIIHDINNNATCMSRKYNNKEILLF